jgi:hypothetical protein
MHPTHKSSYHIAILYPIHPMPCHPIPSHCSVSISISREGSTPWPWACALYHTIFCQRRTFQSAYSTSLCLLRATHSRNTLDGRKRTSTGWLHTILNTIPCTHAGIDSCLHPKTNTTQQPNTKTSYHNVKRALVLEQLLLSIIAYRTPYRAIRRPLWPRGWAGQGCDHTCRQSHPGQSSRDHDPTCK